MCKELGQLSNGYKDLTKGMEAIEFMTKAEVDQIPKYKKITYARITTDYREKKADPYRIRLTVGGNLIDFPGPITSTTAELTTAKLLWNSVLSTLNARFLCLDVENYYLCTPMKSLEYMKIPYKLIRIMKGMYGLPQAGRLANNLLKKQLSKDGYYEVYSTPGL